MLAVKDFKIITLSRVTDGDRPAAIAQLLLRDEKLILSFADYGFDVIFTTRRLIVSVVIGMTRKKRDVTSIPLSKIQVFSTETTEANDAVTEIGLNVRGLGHLVFQFAQPISMAEFNELIGSRLL